MRSAAQRAVRMACLVLTPDAGGADLVTARQVFGAAGAQALADPDALPGAVRRLLDRCA